MESVPAMAWNMQREFSLRRFAPLLPRVKRGFFVDRFRNNPVLDQLDRICLGIAEPSAPEGLDSFVRVGAIGFDYAGDLQSFGGPTRQSRTPFAGSRTSVAPPTVTANSPVAYACLLSYWLRLSLEASRLPQARAAT